MVDAADAGMQVFQALLAKGVITRPVANYGLPQWLRISIGTREENARCIEALREVLPGLATKLSGDAQAKAG
jgi:histidinol-phosphate aminotransferase